MDELDGFENWHDVDDALMSESWEQVLVERPGRRSVAIHTRLDGALTVFDDELNPHERARLCTMSFGRIREHGYVWRWLPPSSKRVRWRGITPRTWEMLRTRRLQHDRKLRRVLTSVFAATPDRLSLILEPEEDLEDEAI